MLSFYSVVRTIFHILRTSMIWLMPVLIATSIVLFTLNTILFFNPESEGIYHLLNRLHQSFFLLMPYLLAVAVGSMVALRLRLPRPALALLSLTGVFAIQRFVEISNIENVNGVQFFVGLTLPFLLVPICGFFFHKKLFDLVRFNLTGSNIKETINLIIPGTIALVVSVTVYWLFILFLSSIGTSVIGIDPVNNPYGTSILIAFLNSLFWFFGIHGYYAILPILDQLVAYEQTAGVINTYFLSSFVFIGGAGATLSLVIAILLFSKDKFHRKIAILSIPFALFGINEIILFCLPIIFNTRMLLPFLAVPIINALISPTALLSGFVSPSPSISLVNTPFLLNSWMSVGGSINGIILQMVCLVIGMFIYAPFVYVIDRARAVRQVEITQFNATFTGILEEYSSDVDDPFHLILLQNEKIRNLQEQFTIISNLVFVLHYQPKVNPKTGEVVGCEALIRAFDDNKKMVSPAEFLPAFHEAGIIHMLDSWVAREASRQLHLWQEEGRPDIKISINMSASTMTHPVAIDKILESIGDNAHLISIEMTEETLASFNETLQMVIDKVKAAGISLEIDDFGTGYSSMSYLTKADFDAIKIDRSFVTDIDDPRKCRLLHALIQFTERLDLPVIVEGVEIQEQVNELLQYDHISIQGWFYAKAMTAEEFQIFAHEQRMLAQTI
ncbi:MAG: EAL domain-containing protein [Oceanospirillales bacterium]|nr:MAG: EAL domain-containing protein [Oceanospirillales bacterium]